MNTVVKLLLLLSLLCKFCSAKAHPLNKIQSFKVLVLSEDGGHHLEYTIAAKAWLNKLTVAHNFTIDYIKNTNTITDSLLSKYQLFIQLDYVPYGWNDTAKKAFIKYIEQGKGGWIGFHHATLLGEFDGFTMWQWFSDFMGGIKYKNYIPTFAKATVIIEDVMHPVLKGVPAHFSVAKEEWYTYDISPRPRVKVLASVNENTYAPDSKIKMGDHPVIWTNPNMKAPNVYIFMGHSPILFKNKAYTTLFKNAIFWAAGK